MAEPDMKYTKELRSATKDVHKMTDILVNAKFIFALSDDAVWAEGLLSFYEIYKFLEQNLSEELLPKEFHRSLEVEKDLAYFLGADWMDLYEQQPAVKNYLLHLVEIRDKSPLLLFAYAFQMYMAIMSGGQLLQKKRMIARKLWLRNLDEPENIAESQPRNDDLQSRPIPEQVMICPVGCAATFFPEKIAVLKAKLRTILNVNYAKFDDQMRADFIQESRNVFIYNAEVIRGVKGVNRVNLRKLGLVLVFALGVYLAQKLVRN